MRKPPFSGTVEVGWWEIKFSLINRKGLVEARNQLTNEMLTMPEHYEKLVELLPLDMWPQFARPKLNNQAQPISERLF
jgi:hypothetical protein